MKKQLLIPPLFFILIIVLVYFVVFYENCAYAQTPAYNATWSPYNNTDTTDNLGPITPSTQDRTDIGLIQRSIHDTTDLGAIESSKKITDTPCTDIFGNIKKDS